MNTFADLTIVTSCTRYGKYLSDWARSIAVQTVRPGHVAIFSHGSEADRIMAQEAGQRLTDIGIPFSHAHSVDRCDLGTARNRAVSMAATEWVVHLDADDTLLPNGVASFKAVSPGADVVQAGYHRVGTISYGFTTRQKLYTAANGTEALTLSALASGNSMFRRSLWQQRPYRTDLFGAWDTCLWVGFAYLGARFRPTREPVFNYRQHMDSIFAQRVMTMGWKRVHTTAMIKAMRRNYSGVAIIVPRDANPSPERERAWQRVKAHYALHHPDYPIIEGICPSGQWIKGAAIAQALSACTAETLVLADADVIVAPDALERAIASVQSGAPWSMPHHLVYRATASATDRICGQSADILPALPGPDELDRNVYVGAPGGGIVVLKHAMYHAIGGIPFAFRGWSSEDRCLALLCDRLLGPCVRGDAPLVHLWHPPQPSMRDARVNVQLLQTLGIAAQQGEDHLVRAVQALPKPSFGTTPKAPVTPVNHAAIQSRFERLGARRPR